VSVRNYLEENRDFVEVVLSLSLVVTNVLLVIIALQLNSITGTQNQILDSQTRVEEQRLELSEPDIRCKHELVQVNGSQYVKVFVANIGTYPEYLHEIHGTATVVDSVGEDTLLEWELTGQLAFEPDDQVLPSGETRNFYYSNNSQWDEVANVSVELDQKNITCREGL
jgi:hypothetical protein